MLKVITILCLVAASRAAKFPSNWKACKMSDADLSGCLKTAVEEAAHDLMPGKPSLNFPPIDPLHINSLTLDHKGTAVDFKLTLIDFDVLNIGKFQINSFETDWKTMSTKASLPDGLDVKGKYKIDGKFMLLPIIGEGNCDFKLDNVTTNIVMHYEEKMVKGETYYSPKDFHIELDPTRLRINLENLFNGNKLLGDNMIRVLNENWEPLWAEIKIALQKGLDYVFLEYSKILFRQIPKSEITPQ